MAGGRFAAAPFGLIRFARPMAEGDADEPPTANDWLMNLSEPKPRDRYAPHRYQVTDPGLDQGAVKVRHREPRRAASSSPAPGAPTRETAPA